MNADIETQSISKTLSFLGALVFTLHHGQRNKIEKMQAGPDIILTSLWEVEGLREKDR